MNDARDRALLTGRKSNPLRADRDPPVVGCQPADLDYIAPAATRGGMASGWALLGKRVWEGVSWVRIPLPPHRSVARGMGNGTYLRHGNTWAKGFAGF